MEGELAATCVRSCALTMTKYHPVGSELTIPEMSTAISPFGAAGLPRLAVSTGAVVESALKIATE